MNRIDRLFSTLTLLQSRKFVPAEKIAERFAISIRTVYRDIKSLNDSGIPVSFEPAKGYFIVQGYFLPPVSFTTEEANALLLMEALVHGFADKSIQKHYGTLLNKVKAVLKTSQKEKVEFLTNNIRYQLPACMQPDFEYLSAIQSAISSQSMLELEYRNKNGEMNKREVEPMGLIFYAFNWHLVAWCNRRQAYRDFKVARIVKLQNTNLPFRKCQHIVLEEYMMHLPVNY